MLNEVKGFVKARCKSECGFLRERPDLALFKVAKHVISSWHTAISRLRLQSPAFANLRHSNRLKHDA